MARVNITRQVKTLTGWKNVSLDRDGRGRIKWGTGSGRHIVEWYEGGQMIVPGALRSYRWPPAEKSHTPSLPDFIN
jgi:hypothetical protein